MKKNKKYCNSTVLMIISVLILFGCSNYKADKNEDFINFLITFSLDEKFQIERIIFPLKKHILDNKLNSEIKENISQDKWHHIKLIDELQNYITDIQSDCDLEECKQDKRIFAFIGIETGIDVKYFFKVIDGKWFLMKIVDFSS